MRPVSAFCIGLGFLLASSAVFADTRTVEVVAATGIVQAIVYNLVTTPASAGITFVILTDDTIQVSGGWVYNAAAGTFSPPSK